MATPKTIVFSFKELAEILAKHAEVQEGMWGLHVRFGLQATNIGTSTEDLKPAAIIPIVEIGIQQFESPNALTIDATKLTKKRLTKPSAKKTKY